MKPAARKPARKRPAKPRAAAKAPTADRLKAKPAGANGGKTARSRIVARASTKAKPPLLRETARRRVEKETAPRPQKPPVPARAAPFRLHALGVRDEHATDRTQIEALLTQAFGRSDEARDLEQWRADGRVVCALVAEYEGEIIGHVAIVSAEAQLDGRALKAAVLAPPAVLPSRQGRGIGSVLLSSALEAARTAGYEALFATGDAAYHQRFGFSAETARPFESGVNAPLLALELKPGALWGVTGAITALARSAR